MRLSNYIAFRCIIRDDHGPSELRTRQAHEPGSFFDSPQWYTGQELFVSTAVLQGSQTQWLSPMPWAVKHHTKAPKLASALRMLPFVVEKVECVCLNLPNTSVLLQVEPYSLYVRWIMTHSTEQPTPPPPRLTGADLQR